MRMFRTARGALRRNSKGVVLMSVDITKGAFKLSAERISSIEYLLCGSEVKIVIRVVRPSFAVKLCVGDKVYDDFFNDEEPYDVLTHIYYIPQSELSPETELCLLLKKMPKRGRTYYYKFRYGTPVFADAEALKKEYDNGLRVVFSETEQIAGGVTYTHYLYNDKNGAPVHAFLTEVNPDYASIVVGTPGDGYIGKKVKATIPDMIAAACKNGRKIVAGVNADFFDMFGDGHPSGLCVKDGRVIINEESLRPFVGILTDGTPVITSRKEYPDIVRSLRHAAAGLQLVLDKGEIFEFGPLEPFAFVRHPRTCAGIKNDGTLLLLVVDGRIPEYSNGASLVDLALLMKSYGADRALNMDGGGSSAIYTKKGDEFILRSRPADLVRPMAKLIRKDYNSLLVELKEIKE